MGIWKLEGDNFPWSYERNSWQRVGQTGQTALPVQGRHWTNSAGTDPAAWPKPGPEPEVSHSAAVTSRAPCPPRVPSALPSLPATALTSAVALSQPGANSEQLDEPHENSAIYLQGRTAIFNSSVVLSSLWNHTWIYGRGLNTKNSLQDFH